MPKGFFSQGVSLLTNGRVSIAEVESALRTGGFRVIREVPAQELWAFGGPAVLVAFRPEVNGGVSVDVVNQQWPDVMGDPKTDPMLFGAWSMGYFGPFAYPGGLERSQQHAWFWPDAPMAVPNHRGFIRIRSSYVGGMVEDAPVLPKDYEPINELMFISRMVMALAKTPGVLCYFNPNGEVLCDMPSFCSIWNACKQEEKLPLLLWMNVRLFKMNEQLGLMDTVGNSQLDVNDVEVIYPSADYEPGTIDYYLRNVTHYLIDLGRDIQTGESIDGPGETELSWIAAACDNSVAVPPRRVLRLHPKACVKEINKALASLGNSTA